MIVAIDGPAGAGQSTGARRLAEVKIYLIAETQVRAQRRLAERPEIGADALATDLRLRDESDAARMRPAADAVQIDTTQLDVEDVVSRIESLVRERLPA